MKPLMFRQSPDTLPLLPYTAQAATTMSHFVSVAAVSRRSRASGVIASSASTMVMYSVHAASRPALRAEAAPPLGLLISWMRESSAAYFSRIVWLLSLEPSLTKIAVQFLNVCACRELIHLSRYASLLYTGMMTLTVASVEGLFEENAEGSILWCFIGDASRVWILLTPRGLRWFLKYNFIFGKEVSRYLSKVSINWFT